MKKKKSLKLLILITFSLAYITYLLYEYVGYFNTSYDKRIESGEYELRKLAFDSFVYLNNSLINELHEKLKISRANRDIDFFILQKNDEVVFFESYDDNLKELNNKYTVFGKIIGYENFVYTSIKVDD